VPSDAPQVAIIAARSAVGTIVRSLEADGMPVVARASTAEKLVLPDGDAAPAVVLHTASIDPSPIGVVRDVRARFPGSILVLVVPRLTLRRLRELLAEGVDAFVHEDDVDNTLGLAVRSASGGLLAFPASLKSTLAPPVLSSREKQVLGLVVLGMTNQEIAGTLHLSESTVKSHLSSSFTKLGVRSRNEAATLILDPETGLGTGILTIADPG
jgi:DNA-binding NarL/FixJ family response regulator